MTPYSNMHLPPTGIVVTAGGPKRVDAPALRRAAGPEKASGRARIVADLAR